MTFQNRWKIEGTLTTLTPLHIGGGGITTRDELTGASNQGREKIEIASVAVDYQKRAYIPGRAIKGNLRSWVSANIGDLKVIETVFGSENPSSRDAQGGKAQFYDASALKEQMPPEHPPPYWDSGRLAGVSASVAIDRVTRTASSQKLFHQEFVPPGIHFNVAITGQDLDPDPGLGELDLLLAALDGFNNVRNPVTIGSSTGDGQGRFTWELRGISRLLKEEVAQWLTSPDSKAGYAGLNTLSGPEQSEICKRATTRYPPDFGPSVSLTLRIDFDGPFLVNDPSRVETPKERDTRREQTEQKQSEKPGHAPLRDPQGLVLLPARSIRGAFRSQAEKIVRTFNPKAACPGDGGAGACQAIYEVKNVGTKLCLTCQLFGAPGWRALVDFSDFVQVDTCEWEMPRQYFVSIDRFTGGAAPNRLFNAEPVYKPALKGTISLGLARKYVDEEGKPKEWRPEPWALGLLALTLRDLVEGDIPLGFGAAKGYGACRAVIEKPEFLGLDAERHQDLLDVYSVSGLNLGSFDVNSFDQEEANTALLRFIYAFKDKVDSFKKE